MKTTVDIKVRPIRIGFIVNPNSKWLEEALNVNSLLWGGTFNAIIPFTKRKSKYFANDKTNISDNYDLLNGMIKNYDLDLLVFTESIDKDRIKFQNRLIVPISDFSNLYNCSQPKYGVNIFEVIYQFHLKEYKFVRKHPIPFVQPILNHKSLFLKAIFGSYSDKPLEIWKSYYEKLSVKEVSCNYSNYLDILNQNNYFPRRTTSLNLKVKSKPNPYVSSIGLIIDRRNKYDIVDYWNLRALGYSIYPIDINSYSSEIESKIIDEFSSRQYELRFPPGSTSQSIFVKGRSVKQTEFNNIKRSIISQKSELNLSFYNVVPTYYTTDYRFDHLINMCQVFESESEVKAELKENNDIHEYHFENILPDFIKKDRPSLGRACFINEISIWHYGFSKTLESQVIPAGIQNLELSYTGYKYSWRVTDKSINYLSSDSKKSITLRIPKPIDIIEKMFGEFGLEVSQSELAQTTLKAIDQLGGYWGISGTIRREPVIKLLHQLENQKILNTNTALSFLKKEFKAGKANKIGENVIDELVEKKVLSIGFQIKCKICSQKNWYNLSELKLELICGKCLSKFVIPYQSTKGINMAYRSKGAFSLNSYAQGIYCPILTLSFFNHNLESLTTPAFSTIFKDPKSKKESEVDIILLTQENRFDPSKKRIILGECKVYKYFDKIDFKRMKQLGDKFPEAILLFSTLRRKLEEKEKVEFRKLIKYRSSKKKNYGEILILTGNELFSWENPPWCWKDIGYEDKYSGYNVNVREVSQLAIATQDIYLT